MNGDQGAQLLPDQQRPGLPTDARPQPAPAQPVASPAPVAQAPQTVTPTAVVRSAPPETLPEAQQPQSPATPPAQEVGFFHKDEDTASASPEAAVLGTGSQASISWTTDGALTQAHMSGQQVRMAGLSLFLALVIFLVTRGDWFVSVAVLAIGVIFSLLGSRRPHSVSYSVDSRGVVIGAKTYVYSDFRAFSVFHDRSIVSIELMPLQRFMPLVLMQLDQTHNDEIIAALAQHIPMQQHKLDFMDRIAEKIRI